MDIEYAIVGGGVIGSSIALELARKRREVLVFEKEDRLGYHSSGRNSGVVHSGINQKPGTFKAQFCVRGNKLIREFCKEKRVPLEECGTLVIARNSDEIKKISELKSLGDMCGVPNLKILDESELREREPNAQGKKALLSPTGSIVDSKKLLEAIAQESEHFGAIYKKGAEVLSIDTNGAITTLEGEKFKPKFLINAAGLQADKLAHQQGLAKDFRIIPFRGEYFEIPTSINSMVYQVPDLRYPFLGVHLTKTIDGKVISGPNATIALGRESYEKQIDFEETLRMALSQNFIRMLLNRDFLYMAYKNARTSLSKEAFLEETQEILREEFDKRKAKPYRAGIRAQLVGKDGRMVNDFKIVKYENSIHILNAVSPGLTCSLAFANYFVNENLKNN